MSITLPHPTTRPHPAKVADRHRPKSNLAAYFRTYHGSRAGLYADSVPNPVPLPPPPLTRWGIIWRNLCALGVGAVAWLAIAERQFDHAAWLGFVDLPLGL